MSANPTLRITSRQCAALALCALLACDGKKVVEPPDEERPLPTSCSDEGGTVHGGVSIGVWAARDGPHRVVQDVNVDVLVIEAGALVCAAPGAMIIVNRLTAEGTADSTIVFTAQDTTSPWGGIESRGLDANVTLAHVRIEHALQGMLARDTRSITSLRNSLIRQIQGPGLVVLDVLTSGELIETVVDSACLMLCAADRAAVHVGGFSTSFHFEESRILNSGAGGMQITGQVRVRLLGGSIEGSTGIGLVLFPNPGRLITIDEVRPMRITGGASYPAEMTMSNAALMLPTAEAQQAWMGNARDTVLAQMAASVGADSVTIRPGLAWIVRGAIFGGHVGTMRLEPGASLTVYDRLSVIRIQSSGSAAEPVTIIGRQLMPTGGHARGSIQLTGTGQDTSRLRHTHVSDLWIEGRVIANAAPLVLEDVTAQNSHVSIGAAGSRITRTTMTGARSDFNAALTIAAPDATVSACEVTGSAADGVRVQVADGVTVRDCNIHGNAGVGLRNLAADAVDARSNWWGSAAGPLGAGGDGVAGNVLFEPYRTEPAPLTAAAVGARS